LNNIPFILLQFCFKSIQPRVRQAAADRADGQAAADPDSSAPTDHRVTEKHLEVIPTLSISPHLIYEFYMFRSKLLHAPMNLVEL